MSRRSAALHCRSRQSSQVASLKFKSGVLKPLHLNLVKLDREFQLLKEQEAAPEHTENGMEKHQKKNEKYGRHHHQYEYQYRSGKQQKHAQPQHVLKRNENHTVVKHVLYKHTKAEKRIPPIQTNDARPDKQSRSSKVCLPLNSEAQY